MSYLLGYLQEKVNHISEASWGMGSIGAIDTTAQGASLFITGGLNRPYLACLWLRSWPWFQRLMQRQLVCRVAYSTSLFRPMHMLQETVIV
jgi:hypothetical protein